MSHLNSSQDFYSETNTAFILSHPTTIYCKIQDFFFYGNHPSDAGRVADLYLAYLVPSMYYFCHVEYSYRRSVHHSPTGLSISTDHRYGPAHWDFPSPVPKSISYLPYGHCPFASISVLYQNTIDEFILVLTNHAVYKKWFSTFWCPMVFMHM